MREAEEKISVERLSNLEEWELYRLVDDDTYSVLCTIGIRPRSDHRTVEYGLWREGQEEPSATGSVESEAASDEWTDEAREEALRSVVYKHEDDLGVTQNRLVFSLSGPRDDDDDDDDEADEDEDE
jgi:hypothetical protein